MKVSVITVVYNGERHVANALSSVAVQSYPDIEHIVIDGGSTDGTLEILARSPNRLAKIVSEPDRGIYDAMNKGIRCATGEVIGFLNSDDSYAHPEVISEVVKHFAGSSTDALFADAAFVDPRRPGTIVRRYSSRHFTPDRIPWGWMPAHPTLFLKREVYTKAGLFKTDYRIAGDFEFIVRAFWRTGIRYTYLPEILVKMNTGGISTSGWRGTLLLNREVLRACRDNGIQTNMLKICSKYLVKIFEFAR